jgi:hypothetical protein
LIFDLLLSALGSLSHAIHHPAAATAAETFLTFSSISLSFATCYYKIKLFSPSPISKQKVNHRPLRQELPREDEILLCISLSRSLFRRQPVREQLKNKKCPGTLPSTGNQHTRGE